MQIELHKDERIIAVVPEYASGPGWANKPIWVYIEQSATKRLRTECIQPDEQTAEMHTLFAPGAAMATALVQSIPVINLKSFSTDKKAVLSTTTVD